MALIISGTTIAEVAHLIGDPSRANMLSALMSGQALTAGELARHAGVSAPTTSGHLAKLTEARLVAVEKQGRHRYYRLASPEVAEAIHALMAVAANGPKRHRPIGPKDEALRFARTCYDHMAGQLAVTLADALAAKRYIELRDGAGLVSDEGRRFFCDFGLDLGGAVRTTRPLCRTCLDWSERRMHLSGRLGAALLNRTLSLGWLARTGDSRALRMTRAGEVGFQSTFELAPGWRRR